MNGGLARRLRPQPPAPPAAAVPPSTVIPAKAGIHTPALPASLTRPHRHSGAVWNPESPAETGIGRHTAFPPHPTLSRWERAGGLHPYPVIFFPGRSFRLYPTMPPPSSFRRRPESRTPVCPGVAVGRGVDSRFRGNDGTGSGMTNEGGGNDRVGRPGSGLGGEAAPQTLLNY